MRCCFCTIITKSHLGFARALFDSLKNFQVNGDELIFYVLIVDLQTDSVNDSDQLLYIKLEDLMEDEPIGRDIFYKYVDHHDRMRWSLKPVLLSYLLKKYDDNIVYVDSDIYFFGEYNFIFRLLAKSSLLLSPHFRTIYPDLDKIEFFANFTEGIFNAGFVGATYTGLAALEWWAKANLFECDKNRFYGIYDDQKYLDLVHSRFDNVCVLRHPGCNLAGWNIIDNQRTVFEGNVLINGTFPVIFIHFSMGTCLSIEYGNDIILRQHLYDYANNIDVYYTNDSFLEKVKKQYYSSLPSVSLKYRVQNKLLRLIRAQLKFDL
jgi:hypothetical protein